MTSTVVTPDPTVRTIRSHEVNPTIPILYNDVSGGYDLLQTPGQGLIGSAGYVWDTSTLSWIRAVPSSGGGGGGAVTIADGANVVEGSLADAAITTNTSGSLSGKLRGIVTILASIWDSVNNRIRVDGSGVTQPVSAVSLPLPTGAATETTLAGILTSTNFQARINTLGQKTSANSTPVVLASDQSVLAINDNGGSITVDGTVAVSGSVAVTGPITDSQYRANLTAATPTFVSVGTSTGTVLSANASRKGLILVNTSSGTISLGLGASAVLNSGITLKPNGTFCMGSFCLHTGQINGIASTPSCNLAIQEFS
jgi:hypothetical protein